MFVYIWLTSGYQRVEVISPAAICVYIRWPWRHFRRYTRLFTTQTVYSVCGHPVWFCEYIPAVIILLYYKAIYSTQCRSVHLKYRIALRVFTAVRILIFDLRITTPCSLLGQHQCIAINHRFHPQCTIMINPLWKEKKTHCTKYEKYLTNIKTITIKHGIYFNLNNLV